MHGRVDQGPASPFAAVAEVTRAVFAVRRPKPLMPLKTALDNVNRTSSTSFPTTPAVLTLTMMESARNGERTTSIAADARFMVVFVFISFRSTYTSDAMRVASLTH